VDYLTFTSSVTVLAPSMVAELLRSFADMPSLHDCQAVDPGRWRLSITVERVTEDGQ